MGGVGGAIPKNIVNIADSFRSAGITVSVGIEQIDAFTVVVAYGVADLSAGSSTAETAL